MKIFGAVFLFALLLVVPVHAQYWSVGGFGSVTNPGLGHAPAQGTGFGNVVFPAVPRGSAALTGSAAGNPYGTLIPGFRTGNGTAHRGGDGHHRGGGSGIYAYPVFVGGYGYGGGTDQPAANSAGGDQPAPAAAPAAPPVIINQYFTTPPAEQGSTLPEAMASAAEPSNDTAYYLIAFKDHTVYSAVAYYTEGDTLHYFTAGNVHNQVSLALVDRALTEQLNRQHNIDVRLPQQ